MKQSEKDFLRSTFTKEYRAYLKVHRPFVKDSRLALMHFSRMTMLLDIINAFSIPFSDIVEKETY